MAKKPKKEAVKPEEQKGTLSAAKAVVVKAADAVASAVTTAAEVVQERVVEPVAEAVQEPKKREKRERVRFVREKREKPPQASAPALPKPSTKATAKLMTKGMVALPKEDRKGGQKPTM